MTEEQQEWTVRPSNPNDRKVHFAGTEEDGREYVEAHFPRVHVEPGMPYGKEGPDPDVYLVAPDGTKHAYRGAKAGWSSDKKTTTTTGAKSAT